ncbi:MAG: hypothetical protein ABSC06_19960 [Rhodopila sp.]|jgi:hypothetical protein
MSRKEAVLLVSRALAMIQLICALMEVTYLPIRFMSLFHHTTRISLLGSSGYDDFWSGYYRTDIAFLLSRIIIYLVFAFVFWNCGPWIEHILLPKREEPGQPA